MFCPPGLLSTTTDLPSLRPRLSLRMRATLSGPDPGGCESTRRTGLSGHVCANAEDASIASSSAPNLIIFIVLPPVVAGTKAQPRFASMLLSGRTLDARQAIVLEERASQRRELPE